MLQAKRCNAENNTDELPRRTGVRCSDGNGLVSPRGAHGMRKGWLHLKLERLECQEESELYFLVNRSIKTVIKAGE